MKKTNIEGGRPLERCRPGQGVLVLDNGTVTYITFVFTDNNDFAHILTIFT